MSVTLDKLQEMWERDAKMDRDNLHEESLGIPSLHAKQFELYNTIFLLRKKAEQQRKNIRHERYEYFSGKADPEVYVENPFPKKIRDKDTMQKFGQEGDNIYSDGTLQILSSNLVPKFQVIFNDMFPYSLSTVSFDATDTDIEYFTADVAFKYTIYNLTDLENNLL